MQGSDDYRLYPSHGCAYMQGDRYGDKSQALPISRNSNGYCHSGQTLPVPSGENVYGYRDSNEDSSGAGDM